MVNFLTFHNFQVDSDEYFICQVLLSVFVFECCCSFYVLGCKPSVVSITPVETIDYRTEIPLYILYIKIVFYISIKFGYIL